MDEAFAVAGVAFGTGWEDRWAAAPTHAQEHAQAAAHTMEMSLERSRFAVFDFILMLL
jgi:hypothetical protein